MRCTHRLAERMVRVPLRVECEHARPMRCVPEAPLQPAAHALHLDRHVEDAARAQRRLLGSGVGVIRVRVGVVFGLVFGLAFGSGLGLGLVIGSGVVGACVKELSERMVSASRVPEPSSYTCSTTLGLRSGLGLGLGLGLGSGSGLASGLGPAARRGARFGRAAWAAASSAVDAARCPTTPPGEGWSWG